MIFVFLFPFLSHILCIILLILLYNTIDTIIVELYGLSDVFAFCSFSHIVITLLQRHYIHILAYIFRTEVQRYITPQNYVPRYDSVK